MIKRIYNNLKWLFNKPPISLYQSDETPICDYCGKKSKHGTWTVDNVYRICAECQKKVYDKVLKTNNLTLAGSGS